MNDIVLSAKLEKKGVYLFFSKYAVITAWIVIFLTHFLAVSNIPFYYSHTPYFCPTSGAFNFKPFMYIIRHICLFLDIVFYISLLIGFNNHYICR